MGRRKAKKASLPPVVKVVIREGQPNPAQESAYRRLWDKLLAPQEEEALGQAPR